MTAEDIDLRRRLSEREQDLRDEMLRIELSAATKSLHGDPGWKQLVTRIGLVEAREIEKIRTRRMDDYELGKSQGALRVFRLIGSAKPMTAEELAETEAAVRLLDEHITELRNLIE